MSSFKNVTIFFNFSYSRVVKKFQKTVFDTIARKKDEITSNFIFFIFWWIFTCKPKISKIWVGEGQKVHPNIFIFFLFFSGNGVKWFFYEYWTCLIFQILHDIWSLMCIRVHLLPLTDSDFGYFWFAGEKTPK